MKYCFIVFLLILSCNSNKSSKTVGTTSSDCNDKWVFESSHVDDKKINDSVTQEIIDGKLWFEIISPKDIGNGLTKAFIKNYRMDGSLESEGEANYYDHPAKDYSKIGIWKFYDCKGNLLNSNKF